MLRIASAILSAAAIAAVLTIFSAPGVVDAGPLDKADEATLKSCTQRPWPYLNCVGTSVGNPRIRLITVERLSGQ